MLTQCPNCETTFRVTSEILRVAQGQVRCGRCQTQFDALQRLIEERAPSTPEPIQPRPAPVAAMVGAEEISDIEVEEERDSLEEITMEGKRIEISGTYRVLDAADTGNTHLRKEVVEEWMEVEDDVGSDDETPEGYVDVSAQAAVEEAEEFDELEDSRERLLDRNFDAADVMPLQDAGKKHWQSATPDDSQDEEIHDDVRAWRRSMEELESPAEPDGLDDLALDNGPARSSSAALVWKILFVPLVLLLVVQVVHHNRAELARNPRVGEQLMQVYRALNLDLTPDWNLHAYEIRQWGVITDAAAPGTLKVRASLINRADFPQPYPLLKLVLEDRWGEQVRAREFDPADYLDPGVAPDRLFAPGTQTNATIVIVDPGPDAEGFRFDVCLRGQAGPVCAEEIPRQANR